jgi:hypothetical protein
MNLLASIPLVIGALLRPSRGFALENVASRQQLTVLKSRKPRPGPEVSDRILWSSSATGPNLIVATASS